MVNDGDANGRVNPCSAVREMASIAHRNVGAHVV